MSIGKFQILVGVGMMLWVFGMALHFHAIRERSSEQVLHDQAYDVVRSLQFIEDSRLIDPDTKEPFCFIYYWGGFDHGGPALAPVSCKMIPPELLTIVKLNDSK